MTLGWPDLLVAAIVVWYAVFAVRRGFVAEKYADLIEALYGPDERLTVETQVVFEDGRSGVLKADVLVRDVAVATGKGAP